MNTTEIHYHSSGSPSALVATAKIEERTGPIEDCAHTLDKVKRRAIYDDEANRIHKFLLNTVPSGTSDSLFRIFAKCQYYGPRMARAYEEYQAEQALQSM